MLTVRVRNFRVAAKQISNGGGLITITALAKAMNRSREYVVAVLISMPWLSEELHIAHAKSDGLAVYARVAERIRNRGELVTLTTLSRELGIGRSGVAAFLQRHPNIIPSLFLSTDKKRRAQEILMLYQCRVRLLQDDTRRPVLPSAYAKEYGVDRTYIYRHIKKYPEVHKLFETKLIDKRKGSISLLISDQFASLD